MPPTGKLSFGMMSFIHETLYGLFRDPYQVLGAAGLESGQQVLEIGCGPGFFTTPAARIVGKEGLVLALDLNPLAVQHVRAKIERENATNARVIHADAARTGLPDGEFDLAFLFGLARPIGGMETIWPEIHRLLVPGGTLAVEGRLRPPGDLFRPLGREGRISRFKKAGGELEVEG